MKSLKEFVYLTKHAGFFHAVFYLFYKFRLKFYSLKLNVNYRKAENDWLKKIYSHLFAFQNKIVLIDGKKLCELKLRDRKFSVIYLRPYSSDMNVFSQVILQENYQVVKEIFDQVFKIKPLYFLDLGANIGLTSLYFAKIYENIKIIAVEPFLENANLAKLNLEINQVKNFLIINGGIWNKETILKINRDFRDGKEWGINLIEDANGTINGYSLNNLLEGYETIDILKIDIEGAEKKLFETKAYAKIFLKKVKCLAMEIHDEFNCREDIYKILIENHFIYYNVKDMTIALNQKFM